MKLHLPKLLRVAVIAAVMSSATSFAATATLTTGNIKTFADDPETPDKNESFTYIDLGYIRDSGKSVALQTWQGDLVIGSGSIEGEEYTKVADKLGAFDDAGKMIIPDGNSNFYTTDGNYNNVQCKWETKVVGETSYTYPVLDADGKLIIDNENGKVLQVSGTSFPADLLEIHNKLKQSGQLQTNQYYCVDNLTVYKDIETKALGDVYVLGEGQIRMGGQAGSNYTGLTANKLTIAGTGSGTHYNVTKTIVDEWHMISGTAKASTGNCTSGNSYAGATAKQTIIKKSLTIEGGYLEFGYNNAQKIGAGTHRMTTFGLSDDFTITQSGGNMLVQADADIRGSATIIQKENAGKMVFRDQLNLSNGTMTINQSGASAKLVFGHLKGRSNTVNVTQSGGADSLIHLTYGSNFTTSGTINIEQSGSGTIRVGGNHNTSLTGSLPGNHNKASFKTNGFEATKTTYSIEQLSGIFHLAGIANIQASKAEIGGKLQVDSSAVLKATELNLSKNANFANSGIIVAGTDATNAKKEILNVSDGGALNLGDGYGSAEGAIKQVAMRGGEMTYAGTVALESIDMSGGALNLVETDNTFSVGSLSATGGALTMSDKSDSVSVGDFTLGQGGYANYLVTDSSATSTPLTIGSSFTVAEDAVFELSFTDTYLSTEAGGGNTISFTINVAGLTGVDTDKISFATDSVVTDCVTWTLSGVSWAVNNNIGQLSGTLTKITEGDITIDEETEINNAVDGDLKLVIKEDTTISADNTHTGGTEIIGAEVTLNSETPLGDGSVTTSGESTIIGAYDADDGSLAILPEVVQNSESLTIEGAFDGTELTEETKTGSYICVDGELGNNGFAVQDGKLIQVVENTTDSATLTIGADGATLTKDGVSYDIHECGYAANLDYTGYRIAEDTHEVTVKEIIAAGGTRDTEITMEAGKLTVDTNVNNLQASGGTVVMANYNVKGRLTGDTKVEVTNGTANWLYGDNDYSGGTTITDATLKLGVVNALGTGEVKTVGTSGLWSTSAIAKLSTTIENNGKLQMRGKFDGSLLGTQELETGDIYVSTTGELGANGFFRQGEALVVVNNASGATLLNTYGKEIVEVYKADKAYVLGADGLAVHTDWNTYYINEADADGTDHEVAMSAISDASGSEDTAVEMKTGVLIADADVTNLKATGGTVKAQGAVITGELSGTTSVSVESGENTLTGDNTYTGDTKIEASKLTVGSESALGASTVYLVNGAVLDLNHLAVGNNIVVSGCSLCNADAFTGNVDVLDGADLEMDGAATVNKVTLHGTGSIVSPNSDRLTVNAIEMTPGASGTISAPVFTNAGGVIILHNGNQLNVSSTLTLGQGTTFVLNGDGYETGSVLATATDGVDDATGRVKLAYGYGVYQAAVDKVILAGIFDQRVADVAVQSNWGIATASRAFVNTVRGQHSNTGCIADGRGTVWAAAFGAYNDLDGSDIDVKGAAVGVDAKVGSCSTVGIAFGYAEGEVSPTGLRDADQEGEYVALYGSHGLKKLSSTSCLSLDWVAAYGNTESEWNSLKWEQDSLQLNTRLNWNKKVTERLGMSVFGGLEYFATGSDTADGVKSGSIQNLRGEIGVGARYVAWGTPASQPVLDEKGATLAAARPGCEKLVLNGEIRYFNDMVRSNPVIEMDGLRGGGENPGRQGMGIEAGATYRISERWSASANYSFNAMEDSVEHRANVGASYTF